LILSGHIAKLKSFPPFNPLSFSSIGRSISSHVPGLTVDSSITVCPFSKYLPIVFAALLTGV
jgi:hypothetical protein